MIAGDALRLGIQGRPAIHEIPVVMVSMAEGQMDLPRAVWLATQRMGRWIPFVEITRDEDRFGLWRETNEVHRLGDVSGGIAVGWNTESKVRQVHGTT